MTEQRPGQAIWPHPYEDVPTSAPGRAPAVPAVSPSVSTQDKQGVEALETTRRAGPRNQHRRAARFTGAVLAATLTFAAGLWWFDEADNGRLANDAPNPPSAGLENPFQRRQAALNRARLTDPAIADFAAPWLPDIADCISDTSPRGPALGAGERSRVRCTAGFVTVYWIAYRSLLDRDAAEARLRAQATNVPLLAPGAGPPGELSTPDGSGRVRYVEYAYPVSSDLSAGQVVAGLWWTDPAKPIAGVILAYWSDLGSWGPSRALWQLAATGDPVGP
ncbi:hypothetical protein ACIA59_28615 [Micromonospora haikouensis]|uniref:hypothetical protein n=1 Tax=Micromonospora haikouensis TaxID=686309 RepID=UPI0037A5FBD5